MLDIRAWTADAMQQFAGESERALTREAHAWFEEQRRADDLPGGRGDRAAAT